MNIQVIAQGTLLAKPEAVGDEREDVTAVMFGTRQEVRHQGQVIVLDTVPTAELVCAGELANALLRLEKGDRVEIRATMTVRCRLADVEDRFAQVRTSFHADTFLRLN
ncbi:hypothetical protein [Aeromicrobium sp. Sec7.5]|uniref:hypothetical protein n=1 Tax=Aeromicrobium sp. Sec7.5 TaxID=3121276 RepID=UPI002FE4769F